MWLCAGLPRLGVLRLLCSPAVMGPDVVQPEAAIDAMGMLEGDERVVLLHEPDNVDAALADLLATQRGHPIFGRMLILRPLPSWLD